MTEQIAIHCLKAIICEEVCEECELYGQTGTDHCETDAVHIAIAALEKQMSKKPDYEGDGYDENGNLIYDYAKCPICGHDFEEGINDWGCGYCSDCGQKLDWGG